MARQWCVHRNHWILREYALRALLMPTRTSKRESHLRGKETNVVGWQMGTDCGLHRLLETGLEQTMEAVRTAPPLR